MLDHHGGAGGKDHVHPGPSRGNLVTLGIVLAVITAVEYFIAFITGMRGFILTALFVLSLVKFIFVAGVFMHLKFDHRLLGWIFGVGFFMATWMTIALWVANLP